MGGGGSGEFFSTGDGEGDGDVVVEEKARDEVKELPKKKRRVALMRVGDLEF